MRDASLAVAMLPAAALLAAQGSPWLPAQMLAAGALAVLLDMGLRASRRPCARSLANAWIICLALAGGGWAAALGGVVAVLVQRCYGGAHLCPFHPAMIGLALVLALWPDAAAVHSAAAEALLATAGLALILLRRCSWQAPLGMLLALAAGALLGRVADGGTIALGAFFVITDPASSPADGRARLAFGIICGALMAVFGWPSLAFAVLVANMAAPWLDELRPCRT